MEHLTNIEHLGIAVKSLEEGNALYTKILGVPPYKQEAVEAEGVRTSFFKVGSTKIELLEATHAESPIAKFIEKRGEGLHHVAYAVDNIKAEMARLSLEGFRLLNAEPKEGADHKWVCFLHPKDTGGTLIELCQDRG
ncbi:MAG: methylmalonyl-CoA epimerase [Schleiferiaceae bacterium]|nr:methylmalonyl-CoA epimerase [Schleiferiaceae bacterium]